MEQAFLLKEGGVLMVVGMLIVYAFLMVLVGAMSLSKFFQRFSYLLPDDAPAMKKPLAAAGAADEGVRIAIAIASAKRR